MTNIDFFRDRMNPEAFEIGLVQLRWSEIVRPKRCQRLQRCGVALDIQVDEIRE